MVIKAIYKNGVFEPLEKVPLEEGTEVEVHPRAKFRNGEKPKSRSVKDYEAFGMWADRDDIGTGVEYVNRIRQPRLKRSE